MNFDVGVAPLTHTVAYTINGLFELGVLCNRSEFISSSLHAARGVLSRRDASTGAVPGQFEEGFEPVGDWTSMTGNSQMAIIWFRAAETTGDPEWLAPAKQANTFNRRLQDLNHSDPGRNGALRGSYPGHRGYGPVLVYELDAEVFTRCLSLRDGRLRLLSREFRLCHDLGNAEPRHRVTVAPAGGVSRSTR